MASLFELVPSLETAKYTITVLAKANSIDPTLALLVVGCLTTLVLAIVIQHVAKAILFLSTALKWISSGIGIILIGLFATIILHRLWVTSEVISMRCSFVSYLKGIEEGRVGGGVGVPDWLKMGAGMLGSWVRVSGGLASGGWLC